MDALRLGDGRLQVAERVFLPRPQPQRLWPRPQPQGAARDAHGPRLPMVAQPRRPASDSVGRHDRHRKFNEARYAGTCNEKRARIVVAKVGPASQPGRPRRALQEEKGVTDESTS